MELVYQEKPDLLKLTKMEQKREKIEKQ